ncbi:hypothetical protein [Dietzia cinnamea]|uniref:hypothetical protein n=1 Tax=Dietzia cinnamea TaxID=321318 RepID=UPI00223BCF35|nr:hypothetical protein [Dietzia cinnamea]MCT2175525.1 hypothetical protein [Dietzia cinnamea]
MARIDQYGLTDRTKLEQLLAPAICKAPVRVRITSWPSLDTILDESESCELDLHVIETLDGDFGVVNLSDPVVFL